MHTLALGIGNFGGPDLIIILVIVLVLFGAKKLPELARRLSQSLNEFRKARAEFDRELLGNESQPQTYQVVQKVPSAQPHIQMPPPPPARSTPASSETDLRFKSMSTAPMDCLCLNRLRHLKISCRAGLIILASVLGCAFSAFAALADLTANQIVDDPTIKGKGKDGTCMDYAIALSSKLAQNGIHGRLIFYRWHIRNTSITGSHVFVAYLIGDGNEWIVDNEIAAPKKVPLDATPMQLVFLLSGDPSAPVDVELEDGLNRLSFF